MKFEISRRIFPRFGLDCPGKFAGVRLYLWPIYFTFSVRIARR